MKKKEIIKKSNDYTKVINKNNKLLAEKSILMLRQMVIKLQIIMPALVWIW